MMLAGTILVVHFDNGNRDLWLVTIQANLALLCAMSLVRLALHRFLAPMAMPLSHLHQLPVQIALGMTANLLLLYFPLGELLLNPRLGGADLQRHADWSGWLAILTNAIAAVWFASQVQPRRVVHIAALIGLLLGVVLAGSADFWLGGDWDGPARPDADVDSARPAADCRFVAEPPSRSACAMGRFFPRNADAGLGQRDRRLRRHAGPAGGVG